MSDKLSQTAGDRSTNVQATNVTFQGISVTEARQIALDVFKANALELAGIARQLFESRAREFVDCYLNEILSRRPEGLQSFRDPDMLHAIFTAQRDYARSGSNHLQQMLVELLVERTIAKDLPRIVLSEAIATSSRLTEAHLDTLSLILLFVHEAPLTYSFNNIAEFGPYLQKNVVPFLNAALKENATYLHLKYCGCVSMDSGGVSIIWRIQQVFHGCFIKGLTDEKLTSLPIETLIANELLIPCFWDKEKYQLKAVDDRTFISLCNGCGISDKDATTILSTQSNRVCDVAEAYRILTDIHAGFANLDSHSIHGMLGDAQLTSVGIALANANIHRRLGWSFDLSHWIK